MKQQRTIDDSPANFDSALRAQSLRCRETPSAGLRRRTIDALQNAPAPASSPIALRDHRALAAIGLGLCAVVVAIGAFIASHQPDPTTTETVAHVDTHGRNTVVPVSLYPQVTLRTNRSEARLMITDPLTHEARVLARQVEQTLFAIQVNLPRPPRLQQDGSNGIER